MAGASLSGIPMPMARMYPKHNTGTQRRLGRHRPTSKNLPGEGRIAFLIGRIIYREPVCDQAESRFGCISILNPLAILLVDHAPFLHRVEAQNLVPILAAIDEHKHLFLELA